MKFKEPRTMRLLAWLQAIKVRRQRKRWRRICASLGLNPDCDTITTNGRGCTIRVERWHTLEGRG